MTCHLITPVNYLFVPFLGEDSKVRVLFPQKHSVRSVNASANYNTRKLSRTVTFFLKIILFIFISYFSLDNSKKITYNWSLL